MHSRFLIDAACVYGLVVAAVTPGCTSRDTAATPPSIVLITLDTTRADALGAYGQPQPTSPRIDTMAADGLLFEQAVVSVPSTLPSHATLFTGNQPYAHGVRANAGYRLTEEKLTLAEALRAGTIRGATTDVTRTEPLPDDSPLWEVPNLIITPHQSGEGPRAQERLDDLFVENLGRYVRGEPLLNEVTHTGITH